MNLCPRQYVGLSVVIRNMFITHDQQSMNVCALTTYLLRAMSKPRAIMLMTNSHGATQQYHFSSHILALVFPCSPLVSLFVKRCKPALFHTLSWLWLRNLLSPASDPAPRPTDATVPYRSAVAAEPALSALSCSRLPGRGVPGGPGAERRPRATPARRPSLTRP